MVFAFIRINHIAMNTGKPDYYVSVTPNGTVNYEGKKNVATKGLIIWRASEEQINKINRLCLEFTTGITRCKGSSSADSDEKLPVSNYVVTTYVPSDYIPLTYIDFDNGMPEKLIKFRTRVEEVLNIWRYTQSNIHFENESVEE